MFLAGGRVYVVENQCLHVGSPLDGGPVVETRVHCPWHGWAYDLRTGRHLTAFGEHEGIRTFDARVDDDGSVVVTVDEQDRSPDPHA